MDTKYKTLSSKAAEILRHFGNINKPAFTIQQVHALLKNASEDAVRKLMRDMVKRGLLLRLKEGVYWMIPYEQDPEIFMPDWHLLAQYIVGDAKYYIGYYSAMQIHSLITQPSLKEQIVVSKQIKPSTIKIKNIPFQFIYHNEKHFFGNKKTWIDSFNKVECSDLEKTFIDGLFKPDYAGGVTEIAKALYKSRETINFKKLLDYALKFDSLAISKRLGYLLELLKIQHPIITTLQELKTNSYFLLEPSHPKEGKMLSRWNIQENLDNQSILSPIFS